MSSRCRTDGQVMARYLRSDADADTRTHDTVARITHLHSLVTKWDGMLGDGTARPGLDWSGAGGPSLWIRAPR